MKSIYIDGYNALFQLRDIGDSFSIEREFFIRTMDKEAALLNQPITLVFDARFTEDPLSIHGLAMIRIIYTEQGQSADDWLIQRVHYDSNPQKLLIISNDRALIRQIKVYGGQTQKVAVFFKNWKQLYNKKVSQNKNLSAEKPCTDLSKDPDFIYWLEAFTKNQDNQ